jgi:uncharacterized protein GlcG (DUF336 family)/mannose-6-phosphate isomerase-like protein (cupin superfamily)
MKTLHSRLARRTIAATLLAMSVSLPAAAQVAARKGLTLDGAKTIATAAATEAKRLGAGGSIAIVDDGGNLLYLERLDNTFPAASTVAIEKARTAATFRKPTRDFEQAIAKGRTSLVAVDVMTPLQGGVPIIVDGQVVGAVGVSGAMSAQQDDDIATLAAAASLSATSTSESSTTSGDVTFVAADKTMTAFAKGQPLVETATYKVHASRREAPGMAEIHTRDTDIIYVLDGRATIVTGGSAIDSKTTAADEVRGARIDGGATRTLAKGDVLIVPAGVPHWFRDVTGPFLYYVVKVTAPAGGTR